MLDLTFGEQRQLVLEWKKYASSVRIEMDGRGHREDKHTVFLLPGSTTHRVCKNALARIIGKSKHAWDSIGKPGKDVHGLSLRQVGNRSMDIDHQVSLFDFMHNLTRLAAPRATKLITSLTADGSQVQLELKNADPELIELPFCHSKRAIYRSYLAEIGWKAEYDSLSRQTDKEMAGVAAETDDPISWPTFCRFWQLHFPKLVIQRAAEDICDDCVIFANRHKYLSRQREARVDDENASGQLRQPRKKVKVMQQNDDGDDVEVEVEEETPNDLDMGEQESVILKAGRHVEMARKQREYFNHKKQVAKEHRSKGVKQEERTYCFVADFAQNMNIPNFSAEQPGATYYFSPMNVFPFGVVDCSTEPSQLTAHIFSEGEAKKGGNSVASMIWKELKIQGLLNGVTAHEINLVFDNCAGQNKNRMVSRLLFYLVKLKVCRTARAIFLIKGHTKNDCDRMFNLLKAQYRKMDVFTPTELIALMDLHPQCSAIPMEEEDFKIGTSCRTKW